MKINNTVSICFGITVFFLVIALAQSQDADNIDVNDFLLNLLNTTEEEIVDLVDSFEYTDIPEDDVTFIYYLPNNETVNITAQNYSQVLDITKPIVFIIHGWTSSGFAPWVSEMCLRYIENTNYNVIAIDWAIWAGKNYFFASTAVQAVGFYVGNFIQVLYSQDQSVLGRIHVLGHSLGAHAAGFTGKRVIFLTSLALARVTGMDAAGPLFEIPFRVPSFRRLDVTDAVFVDLIHTDRGVFGVTGSYGKCDFFVNGGGPIQPGCRGVGNLIEQLTCSHGSSHEYYTISIYDATTFQARSCPADVPFNLGFCNGNSQTLMGESVNRNAIGNYYLLVSITFSADDKAVRSR